MVPGPSHDRTVTFGPAWTTQDLAATADGMIGVFDSGVGGLTVHRALVQRLPQADFTYLADQANAPYGGRTGTIKDPFGNTWYLSSQTRKKESTTKNPGRK